MDQNVVEPVSSLLLSSFFPKIPCAEEKAAATLSELEKAAYGLPLN